MTDGKPFQSASIADEHYQEFRQFLEKSCGIVLGDNKQYLVASRLGPLMGEQGLGHLGELLQRLGAGRDRQLTCRVIEAMTTNETQFFRDVYPFEQLSSQLFPELQRRRQWQVRVWSAACSSGQEAYSISMALQEYNEAGGRLEGEIVGTDISTQMVEQANSGRYNAAAVARGLSPERLRRHFQRIDANTFEIRPELKRRVSFRQLNLLESFAGLGRFDVIFCRNVLIYFSQASRQDILGRMRQALNPGGYLVLGASETLGRDSGGFEMERLGQGVVYRPK